jgi:hypothetical protein
MNGKIILAVALTAASGAAGAQQVWRCGSSYSAQPCPGGTSVSAADPSSPGDAARATRAAQADARRAAELEKARLAQEKAAPKAVVMGPAQASEKPSSKSDKNGSAPKKGKLEQFTAVSPGAGGKKKKD